jgi:hypothetical protein
VRLQALLRKPRACLQRPLLPKGTPGVQLPLLPVCTCVHSNRFAAEYQQICSPVRQAASQDQQGKYPRVTQRKSGPSRVRAGLTWQLYRRADALEDVEAGLPEVGRREVARAQQRRALAAPGRRHVHALQVWRRVGRGAHYVSPELRARLTAAAHHLQHGRT